MKYCNLAKHQLLSAIFARVESIKYKFTPKVPLFLGGKKPATSFHKTIHFQIDCTEHSKLIFGQIVAQNE